MALKKLHDFFDSDMLPNSLILSHVLVAKMAGRALELKDILSSLGAQGRNRTTDTAIFSHVT